MLKSVTIKRAARETKKEGDNYIMREADVTLTIENNDPHDFEKEIHQTMDKVKILVEQTLDPDLNWMQEESPKKEVKNNA